MADGVGRAEWRGALQAGARLRSCASADGAMLASPSPSRSPTDLPSTLLRQSFAPPRASRWSLRGSSTSMSASTASTSLTLASLSRTTARRESPRIQRHRRVRCTDSSPRGRHRQRSARRGTSLASVAGRSCRARRVILRRPGQPAPNETGDQDGRCGGRKTTDPSAGAGSLIFDQPAARCAQLARKGQAYGAGEAQPGDRREGPPAALGPAPATRSLSIVGLRRLTPGGASLVRYSIPGFSADRPSLLAPTILAPGSDEWTAVVILVAVRGHVLRPNTSLERLSRLPSLSLQSRHRFSTMTRRIFRYFPPFS